MKANFLTALAGVLALLLSLNAAHAADLDADQVQALLKNYERVLNASDVAGVLALYTTDGVFMAPHNPSAVGIDQVEAAYTAVFDAIDLNVTFGIVEVTVSRANLGLCPHQLAGHRCTINATREQNARRQSGIVCPAESRRRLEDRTITASQPPIRHANRTDSTLTRGTLQ